MVKQLLLCCVLLFLVFSRAAGQTVIHGSVRSIKGLAVSGATVRISKSSYGVSTDSTGSFLLPTGLTGKHAIVFSAVGYRADSISINIKGDSVLVNIKLKDSLRSLEAVTVKAGHRLPDIDVKQGTTLNDFEVATTAGAIADIASALRTLPGAAPQSNQTGFYVRGGDANETAAYMDGLLLKNPFGSKLPDISNRSRFSPFMFKETTFSSGGYSAQYGQALSSLLLLDTKDLPDKTSNEFNLLTLGFGGAHTERMENSSYMIGANYFNFNPNDNLDPQNVDWVKNPQQEQVTFEYKWKPNPTGIFKVLADYSDTRLSLNVLNPDSLVNDLVSNTNKNLYLNTNYDGYLSNRLRVQTGIAYNKTIETGDINTGPYHQNDDVVHARFTLTKYIFKKSDIVVGADVFTNTRNEGYGDTARQYSDVLTATYAETELYLTRKLMVRIGARAEYDDYLNEFTLAPRTTLIYKLTGNSQLTGSYGVFYQKPDDSYLTQTKNLDEEKATHYILSYEYNQDSRTFRVEGYYKDYSDLTKLVTPVFSGLKSYGPVIINGFSDGGSGYAQGFEVFWRDKLTLPIGEYYISYSYTDSRRDYLDYPAFAQPPFAPKHTLNVVFRKYISSLKTQFSGTYTFSSGRTYYNPLNPVFMGNTTQAYNNFSTTISYLPELHNKFTVINFTIENLPGFNQVFGYRYSQTGTYRVPILPTARRDFVLTLLMNIGDATFNY
jgi:hypothetical protein